jgi:hypothetical protein
MFINANPFSLFSVIVFLRFVFNRLSVENDISLVTILTGKEAKIFKIVYIEGCMFSLYSAKADTTFIMGFVFICCFPNENSPKAGKKKALKHYIFNINTAERGLTPNPPVYATETA